MLSQPQRRALRELAPIAKLALGNEFMNLPIKPRTHSLICSPSGTGKSHLMKELGNKLRVPVLLLNVSSWQPQGSRGDSYTWDRIVEFLDLHPKGIIVLDEIDKIDSSSDWAGYIRLEIHDLLDGVIPQCVDVPTSNSISDLTESDLW